MLAYKVLVDGRSGFTGWSWPLPAGDAPGDWVTASGRLELCANGIHAATISQLAQWLGQELWTIELDGEILETEPALVASRGRLLGTVEAWDEDARKAFGEDCAARARPLADACPSAPKLVELIERFAGGGLAGPVGYWTAVLAGESLTGRRAGAEYEAAFTQERDAQTRWLRQALEAAGA